MNLNDIKQARELKKKLDEAQRELGKITVEATQGKGAVKVVMDGQQQLQSITISPSVIDPAKVKQLEEMIARAVNEAIEKSQKAAAKQLGKIGGLPKIPGLT
ncbi:MAG: YbaB/EbfC family nucleoid-associated protein [Chloroflexi bacterium]|nr:YbaB/EbfC family nucleoid-associated protein [Chloroflexota bacterium]